MFHLDPFLILSLIRRLCQLFHLALSPSPLSPFLLLRLSFLIQSPLITTIATMSSQPSTLDSVLSKPFMRRSLKSTSSRRCSQTPSNSNRDMSTSFRRSMRRVHRFQVVLPLHFCFVLLPLLPCYLPPPSFPLVTK